MITTTAAFVGNLGVNLHWQNASAAGAADPDPHTHVGDILADLKTVGITAMRGRAPPAMTDTSWKSYSKPKLEALYAGGVSHHCMMVNSGVVNGVRGPSYAIADQLASIKAVMADRPALDVMIEGLNEPQNWPNTYGGLADTIKTGPYPGSLAYQAALYAAVKADPALKAVPVAGPSCDPVGAVAALCDYANQHVYPYCAGAAAGQAQPFVSAKRSALLSPYAAGKPWVATECGFSSANDGSMAVDKPTQARLLLALVCQMARLGCARPYVYELYDDSLSAGVGAATDNYCGLFTRDRKIKPAGQALANLMSFLAGATAPSAPDPAVFAEPAGAYLLPLQRAAGVWDLAVWNEPLQWDHKSRAAPGVTPAPTTIVLPFTAKAIEVYDPITQALKVDGGAIASITVSLSGYPLIVRVTR